MCVHGGSGAQISEGVENSYMVPDTYQWVCQTLMKYRICFLVLRPPYIKSHKLIGIFWTHTGTIGCIGLSKLL